MLYKSVFIDGESHLEKVTGALQGALSALGRIERMEEEISSLRKKIEEMQWHLDRYVRIRDDYLDYMETPEVLINLIDELDD